MNAAKLLSILLLLIVFEASHSASEWKKYENGKVESHKKRDFRLTKNHTLDDDVKKQQRILHSHHGERMNRYHDKTDIKEVTDETAKAPITWDYGHRNRERHHKNEKKVHYKEANDSVRKLDKAVTERKGLVNEENDELPVTTKAKKKRSRPDGMTSMAWRKAQRQVEESKIQKKLQDYNLDYGSDNPKRVRNSKSKASSMKKKMVIARMNGNENAKQVWKEAFRGEDRITKSQN